MELAREAFEPGHGRARNRLITSAAAPRTAITATDATNGTGPPSPPSFPKSTAVVGGPVVVGAVVVGAVVVVTPVVVVAIAVVESSVVELATVVAALVVAAVVEAAAVVGGAVVGGAVVGGAVVAVVAMGGWGSEVQSLRLRVGAGEVVAAGGLNLGGGIFAATLSSENDHPSNVPGGGWRLPAPSVA